MMDLEGFIRNEVSQRKTNTMIHSHVASKKKTKETENPSNEACRHEKGLGLPEAGAMGDGSFCFLFSVYIN